MRVGRKSLTGITITWEGSHVPHFPPPACFQTLSSFLQSVISETELARFNRIILKRISPPPLLSTHLRNKAMKIMDQCQYLSNGMRTYPSPKAKVTLICYQLTVNG